MSLKSVIKIVDNTHNAYYNIFGGEEMRFREIEKILLADGWKLKNVRGSHNQYIHPTKKRKGNNTESPW